MGHIGFLFGKHQYFNIPQNVGDGHFSLRQLYEKLKTDICLDRELKCCSAFWCLKITSDQQNTKHMTHTSAAWIYVYIARLVYKCEVQAANALDTAVSFGASKAGNFCPLKPSSTPSSICLICRDVPEGGVVPKSRRGSNFF